jgi:hypothetical protein
MRCTITRPASEERGIFHLSAWPAHGRMVHFSNGIFRPADMLQPENLWQMALRKSSVQGGSVFDSLQS